MPKYVAIDLGAESGRILVATLDPNAGRLALEEVYRFPNGVIQVGGSLYWDVLHLWSEIKKGLHKAATEHQGQLRSVAVDTWGIDYALLDRRGVLIGNPYAYRDPRTAGVMQKAIKKAGKWEIYRQSGGIQFMAINTLYQLYAAVLQRDPTLSIAETFLMIPDLFGYWLTGERACEFTDATSTQFYDGNAGGWAAPLLDCFRVPTRLFPRVIMPGTQLGTLRSDVAEETGLGPLPVIAVAGHDTASAVVAVPAEDERFAWLSSGTWSLLGGISDKPIITDQSLAFNFSSYGGPGGQFLPWKNIMGLWLVQECRRAWARAGEDYSYQDIAQMAAGAKPFVTLLNPDDPGFLAPKDMPAAIAGYCRQTNQPVPASRGEMVRAILESLALCYRWTLEKLSVLQRRSFAALYVVGGGSKNALLCQLTADAIGLPVVAGPAEATGLGNVALQAVAMGDLASLQEARQLIRRGADVALYQPGERGPWEAAYARFATLIEQG